MNRTLLEESRHRGSRVYGYKKAYCDLNSCCEHCDVKVRRLCKIIRWIEDIQIRRILKVCNSSEAVQAGEGGQDGD